jgi:hypothetical protein
MSCNGCRVLRKGCSDACVLRPSIEWIHGAQPQANATVFVAKFFGRAGLVASLAAVPLHHRPGKLINFVITSLLRWCSIITFHLYAFQVARLMVISSRSYAYSLTLSTCSI